MKIHLVAAVVLALSVTVACNTNPEAAKKSYLERGNTYFDKGKYKEALIMYRNALKKDPKYGEAYYRTALTQLKIVEPVQAFEERVPGKIAAARDLHRAIEFQPDNMDAYAKLIDIYLELYLGFPERPKTFLTELRALEDRLAKRGQNSFELTRLRGYLALTDKKREDAINYFRQAAAMKPNEVDIALVLMQTLVEDKKPEEAEKLAKDLLARDPKAAMMYNALYMLYVGQNRVADAEQILKAKVNALPDDLTAHLHLATHYFTQRRLAEMDSVMNAVLQDPKRFPNANKAIGDLYLRFQNFEAASRVYRQGMERYPDKKPVYQKVLCETLAQQGRLKEANALIDEVIKANPKDDEALGMRAALKLMSGSREDAQAALNDLQTAVTRLPKNPILRYNLGRAFVIRNNTQQAKIQFEEAIKLDPRYLQPRIALADVLMRTGEYGRVLQMTGEILAVDPKNVSARLMRTRALMGVNELRQAREELGVLAKEYPGLWEAKFQLAALDTVDNHHEAAQAVYREMIDKTRDPRAVMGLAESYMRQNRVDDAMRVLNEQLARDPNNRDYRIFTGSLGARAKRWDIAINSFREIVNRDQRDVDAWVKLGEAQRMSGDMKSASESFLRATAIQPNNVIASLELAMMYDAEGRRDKSKPLYDQVLRTDPENPIALNNAAYNIAEYGGDLDQALSMAQRARQRMPQNTDISDTLGVIYLKKNLSDTAIGIFREILKQQPSRATYRYHLGWALVQKGNRPEAKKELEAALRNSPNREEEIKIRELIAKIG